MVFEFSERVETLSQHVYYAINASIASWKNIGPTEIGDALIKWIEENYTQNSDVIIHKSSKGDLNLD